MEGGGPQAEDQTPVNRLAVGIDNMIKLNINWSCTIQTLLAIESNDIYILIHTRHCLIIHFTLDAYIHIIYWVIKGKFKWRHANVNQKGAIEQQKTSLLTWVEAALLQAAGTADIILFADEFVLVYDVEFLPGGELLVADHTGETIQVEYFVPGFPH